MRVKIIESMANKRAIVSTEIGAEGISYTNNENILISNSSEKFATSIIKLLSSSKAQFELGNNAYKFVQENFDFINIANKVLTFIQD